MTARRMLAKFGARCKFCRKEFAAGAPIYYDRAGARGLRAWHTECNPEQPQPAQDQPKDAARPLDVLAFDSVAEAIAAGNVPHNLNRDHWQAFEGSQYGTGPKWYGVESLADVRRIVECQQWPDGLARLMDKLGDIGATLTPQNVRRVRRWADSGDSVEMPRVWAGRLGEAWQRTYRAARPAAAQLRILVNLATPAKAHSDVAFWRGAAAVRMADLLTAAGYNVQIEAINAIARYTTNGRDCIIGATVKPFTAPLDLLAIASTVCLPGFTRHYVYRIMDAQPNRVTDGHGRIAKYADLAPLEPGMLAADQEIIDADTARAWINQQLLKLEGAEPIAA